MEILARCIYEEWKKIECGGRKDKDGIHQVRKSEKDDNASKL